MKILISGTAGFIGFHLAKQLLNTRSHEIIGLDSINDYYNSQLKYDRLIATGIGQNKIKYGTLIQSELFDNYRFIQLNLEDRPALETLFTDEKFDIVCHLAAQAGVRYSIENPYSYIDSNIVGFINILECCRHKGIKHLIYASSSSVYGINSKVPFSENDRTDYPVSLYAATKKASELMAYTYSHLYHIPMTGLRFFTVYGPWGRPDMAPMLFTKAIMEGNPIKVFNNGNLSRDFTYVDDIIDGIIKMTDKISERTGQIYHRIYNIGNSHPVKLIDFIHTLEDAIGKKAVMEMYPMQQGDVYQTYADVSAMEKDFDYAPSVTLQEGIAQFIKWYKNYNG
jgi:UDP-glucuronate 4-epimerase